MAGTFRELQVWQMAMDLVTACYRLTDTFPKTELYGLSSQLQRAAVSIPANIAEGQQRQHRKEFVQHLSIAHGSLAELETHIEIAARLRYIADEDKTDLLQQIESTCKMLNGLKRSLEN